MRRLLDDVAIYLIGGYCAVRSVTDYGWWILAVEVLGAIALFEALDRLWIRRRR